MAFYLERIKHFFGVQEQGRIAQLDGLRAFAIAMVFNVHFFGYFGEQGAFNASAIVHRTILILRAGHIGVDLFFVISGFLIFELLRKRETSAIKFFGMRFARLLPAHVAVLLVISFVTFYGSEFLVNMLLIAPLIKGVTTINYVTWSLAWELIFYALIFVVVQKMRQHDPWRAAFLCLALAAVLLYTFDGVTFTLSGTTYSLQLPAIDRFFGFIAGILLSWAISTFGNRRFSILWLAPTLALLLALQIVWSYQPEWLQRPLNGGFFIFTSLTFALLVFFVCTQNWNIRWLLCWPPLVFLGRISYSFYLIHGIALATILNRLPMPSSTLKLAMYYVVTFGISVLAAAIVFAFFERPYLVRTRSGKLEPKKSGL
ncbi:acyltransferase [Herbaspirillum seropedicae]|uniref:acyltransferase family protein n=1 Tax=Herbaspirillum seropedicae TaxID=964 RepID=UPI001123DC63|nr:acyltransferase [Herbaspirillum seropedicae]QDD65540.1 acyltransferase [Herbaspirillum seropedicae]